MKIIDYIHPFLGCCCIVAVYYVHLQITIIQRDNWIIEVNPQIHACTIESFIPNQNLLVSQQNPDTGANSQAENHQAASHENSALLYCPHSK